MSSESGGCVLHKDVIRRITKLEEVCDDLEKRVNQHSIMDAEVKKDIKSLQDGFDSLKTEVLSTVRDHTERTWGLINKGIKVITVLVAVIAILSGAKIVPELWKLFMGI